MSINNWITKNTRSLKGKTVAITGSTGGLGKEICFILASLEASLVLVDRNYCRSLARREEILALYPNTCVTLVTADMEDICSVKHACRALEEMPIDYVILNAGAYSIPRKKCETGYDNVFQINFVSQYYIARYLAPLLKERGGKVVAVGSIAHNYSKTDKSDIDFSARNKASLVYGNAKRYLMYSLFDLSKKIGVDVSVAHPGITFTNITAHYPPLIFAVIKHPMKVIFMRPRKACLSVIKGLFENCGERRWIGPSVFDVWGYPKKRQLKTCADDEYFFINSVADRIFNEIMH